MRSWCRFLACTVAALGCGVRSASSDRSSCRRRQHGVYAAAQATVAVVARLVAWLLAVRSARHFWRLVAVVAAAEVTG
jgi:hypothetical protein